MTAPKRPRIIPATARIDPKRKPSKAQKLKTARQVAAWKKKGQK